MKKHWGKSFADETSLLNRKSFEPLVSNSFICSEKNSMFVMNGLFRFWASRIEFFENSGHNGALSMPKLKVHLPLLLRSVVSSQRNNKNVFSPALHYSQGSGTIPRIHIVSIQLNSVGSF